MKAAIVQQALIALSDPHIAIHSQRFFKTGPGEYGEGDQFRGIRVPTLRQVARQFQDLSLDESEALLHSPFHEDRLTALLILVRQIRRKNAEHKGIYELYLRNTAFINNWDLVDTSAEAIVGAYLSDRDRASLTLLARSPLLWERRIAMMATFHFIKQREYAPAFEIARILLDDPEDLIHKAVGWMLREIGNRDLEAEESFLRETYREMPRTMLRYAIEKFPEVKRKAYLNGEIRKLAIFHTHADWKPIMEINIAVVPVAGLGSRLLPATKSQPKEMLPVGRKPVVQYVVEELTRVGMEQILFITGQGKTSIENHFDLNHELIETLRETGKEELLAELNFERAPLRYFFTRQRQLLGLGHAVLCAESFVGNRPFAVALGDSIIGMHAQSDVLRRMADCFATREAAAVVAFEEVPMSDVHRYGVAKPKERGDLFELEDVVEKPSREDAPSNLAIAARYVFAPSIFKALNRIEPGAGGEIQLTDAIRLMIQEGGKVYGICLRDDERRYDIGNFESYFQAFVEFALSDEKYGADLRRYLEELLHANHS